VCAGATLSKNDYMFLLSIEYQKKHPRLWWQLSVHRALEKQL
jgi:hypothetical protein